MRYEAAVETNLTFHTEQRTQRSPFPEPETVVIEFEGRRFVWHELGANEEGEERWPVVTTMVGDPEDYAEERRATASFLSALSFSTRQRIRVVMTGGAGFKLEMDPPLVNALRRGLVDHNYDAPAEVVAVADRSLRIVLGYYREGLNAATPFFGFLAFWNALDVACEDVDGRLSAWIRATAPGHAHLRGSDVPVPADWWVHLQNGWRNAVAHTIRDPERAPDLDPDDPVVSQVLGRDARLLEQLVQIRVRERWGDFAVWLRPREAPPGRASR